MKAFEPLDPDFQVRVRRSFERQKLMSTIGARLLEVAPGRAIIEMPFRDELTQQHGYIHAGIVTAIVDSACGYAALSLMAAGADVLSVEYKINFLSPARGKRFIARGQVVKPGRNITVCEGDVTAETAAGQGKVIAAMLATMITLKEK